LEHTASNPVSTKNINATESSANASDDKIVVEALCSSKNEEDL